MKKRGMRRTLEGQVVSNKLDHGLPGELLSVVLEELETAGQGGGVQSGQKDGHHQIRGGEPKSPSADVMKQPPHINESGHQVVGHKSKPEYERRKQAEQSDHVPIIGP